MGGGGGHRCTFLTVRGRYRLKKVKTSIKPLLLGKTLLWKPSPYLTIRALLFNFSVISTADMTTSNLPLRGEG